jgi:hypothetical protein
LYSEGLGLAAAYLADQLKLWKVKPAGDDGTYFQRVRVLGVKSQNRSTVVVETGGETRIFANGEGVSFPVNVGAKQLSYEIGRLTGNLDHPPARDNRGPRAGKGTGGKLTME